MAMRQETETSMSARRDRRLEIRTTAEEDELIREAAGLEHTTVSSFVLRTAMQQAQRVIAERRHLMLSEEAADEFFAALDAPAEPVAELVELFSRPRLATP